MHRRTFLGTALALANASPLFAALRGERWDDAAEVLERATTAKLVDAAVLHVVQEEESFTRHFGKAASGDAMFLLGSISKPINVTAVMTLFDQRKFQLEELEKEIGKGIGKGVRLRLARWEGLWEPKDVLSLSPRAVDIRSSKAPQCLIRRWEPLTEHQASSSGLAPRHGTTAAAGRFWMRLAFLV